jgi:2-enoate reductase
MEGGRTLEEGLELCRMAEEAGYDALNVDVGRYEVMPWLFPTSYMGAAVMKDVAKAVKQQVSIPIIMVGNITRPEIAEEIIANGSADFVAIGRGLLAEPEWANKAKFNRVDEIRPCIMCNEKCIGRLNEGKGITCSVNPQCGRERTFVATPAFKPRRITVVGGGPGGMQAAITAAKRGHNVTLLEKASSLGGQLILAESEPFKVPIKNFNAYMQRQVALQDIEVRLNTAATEDVIAATQPDAVIVAVGANVFVPPIKGFDSPSVLTVSDLLEHEVKGDETVVVVGGGLVGSETALGLAMQGCKVTVIEMLPQIAGDLMFINRTSLLELLDTYKVQIATDTTCKEIVGQSLICTEADGSEITLDFDFVVTATGTRPEAKQAAEIQASFQEVYLVGDCTGPAKIGEAVHKGYAAGLRV